MAKKLAQKELKKRLVKIGRPIIYLFDFFFLVKNNSPELVLVIARQLTKQRLGNTPPASDGYLPTSWFIFTNILYYKNYNLSYFTSKCPKKYVFCMEEKLVSSFVDLH